MKHWMFSVIVLLPAIAVAQTTSPQQLPRVAQEIIVTATAAPVPIEQQGRTVAVFTRQDVQQLGLTSFIEALRLVPGMDVRARGPKDVQTDFSIRGATFGQHLVLADGLRLNDSQSGHHNGEIPMPLVGVDRVEVVAGASSSVHGADALGGAINIISRTGPHVSFLADGGQHGYASTQMSYAGGALPANWLASGWASRSSGFMYDRDFSMGGGALRGSISPAWTFDIRHQRRAFGANGFYGNSPSKEWTDQTLGGLTWTRASDRWTWVVQGVVKNHGDHFLWDVRVPGVAENVHRTNAVDVRATLTRVLQRGWTVTIGAGGGGDGVRSTNLSNRSYGRGSAFAELQMPISPRTSFQAGLRYDGYSTFGQSVSPAISITTSPRASLRLRASVAHAFRVPTFTELYYRDPANLGTPDLTPEQGWSVDAGVDWMIHGWQLSVSPFGRWDQDVIDWVKAEPSDLWRSTNVRDVTSTGVETALARRWRDAHIRVYFVSLNVEAPQLDLLSKYVLEYAEVQSGTSVNLPVVAGIRLALSVDHRTRADGQSYELMSGRISRSMGPATLYLDGSNLLNEVYREISTVEMPGRWITGGLALDY